MNHLMQPYVVLIVLPLFSTWRIEPISQSMGVCTSLCPNTQTLHQICPEQTGWAIDRKKIKPDKSPFPRRQVRRARSYLFVTGEMSYCRDKGGKVAKKYQIELLFLFFFVVIDFLSLNSGTPRHQNRRLWS